MARLFKATTWYLLLWMVFCFLLPMTMKSWRTESIPKAFYFPSVTDPAASSPSPDKSTSTSTSTSTSPSPEDVEVMALLDLLTWPEPQGVINSSTSPLNCEWQILHPKDNYSVGETLEVVLTAKDRWNRSKAYGGDFFQAKLHSPNLKAGVRGLVTDHQNGTYTISFLLLWPGDVVISIRLFHSSEAVQVIRKARDSRPDKVYFTGIFQRNGTEEKTECNLEMLDRPLCVYGDKRIEETWYCARPKTLPCDSLVYHMFGGYRKVTDAAEDKLIAGQLTNKELPIKIPPVHVITRNSSLDTKKLPACAPGQLVPQPSGYYYNDIWTTLACSHQTFHTPPEASACLRGKIIYMFGDSTLRQWWEYLLSFIPSIRQIDLHVRYKSGPLLAVDPDNGLMILWRAHGNPLRTEKTMMADIHYMANDITNIGGGPDVVIVFTIWAHFTTYPVELYIHRVRNIRRSITELLKRSPKTTVIIKTANTSYTSIYGSDWLSLQLDMILRKMFSELPVAIVDAWDMTSCHYLKEDIHPGKIIIQNEVDMFLSFICPK
ncbi:NXPE family member 3-like isoform X1 [Lissotriton helveticus]